MVVENEILRIAHNQFGIMAKQKGKVDGLDSCSIDVEIDYASHS